MTEPRRHQPQQRRSGQPSQALAAVSEARLAQREQRKEAIGRVALVVREERGNLERLLPDHMPIGAFMSAAGAALWKSEKLMEGAIQDPEALLVSLRESASLGHLPGTRHYWLTPRRRKIVQGNVTMHVESVLGIEGYEGIVERMYRSGGVLSVHTDVVYAATGS
jgi:recombination protein RecT